MSNTFRKLLLAAGATAVLGAMGTGVAFAAGPSAATQRPAVSHSTTSVATADGAGTADKAEQPGTETDGPGGHADPAGNVDHQFDGNE